MAAPVIIILGPPGAGKGTQASILAQRMGAAHLSSGQIMRDSGDTAVIDRIGKGNLATTEDFLRIAANAIEAVDINTPLILDSVGKMLPEAKWLMARIKSIGRPIQCVIYLNVDQEEAVGRNLQRGREDDSAEAQKVRWELYRKETLPVLDFYREMGVLQEVNGEGSVEEVSERIKEVVGK